MVDSIPYPLSIKQPVSRQNWLTEDADNETDRWSTSAIGGNLSPERESDDDHGTGVFE